MTREQAGGRTHRSWPSFATFSILPTHINSPGDCIQPPGLQNKPDGDSNLPSSHSSPSMQILGLTAMSATSWVLPQCPPHPASHFVALHPSQSTNKSCCLHAQYTRSSRLIPTLQCMRTALLSQSLSMATRGNRLEASLGPTVRALPRGFSRVRINPETLK